MMKAPIDAASRVSAELSAVMEKLVNDPDREAQPSLAEVRADLAHMGADAQ
jgi:hypothetical protein